MTASSRLAKAAALIVAVTAHAALAVTLVTQDTPLIEGASGASEVRLGNDFADMSAGTLTAEQPDTATPVSNAEPAPQDRPEHATPLKPEPTPQEDATRAEVQPANKALPVMPEIADAPDRIAALQPVQPEPVEPATEDRPERLTGEAPDSAAVSRSVRPQLRDPDRAPKPKPVVKAQPAPKPVRDPKPAPTGGARDTRAGEATGKSDATARQSGNSGRQQAAGNAAVSNYPGIVMRKLSRAGKPRVRARGAAVVAFSISGNGGVSSVSLARSSGSAELDRAALQLVRGAAPFPQPPQGAQRSFSIQIKGR